MDCSGDQLATAAAEAHRVMEDDGRGSYVPVSLVSKAVRAAIATLPEPAVPGAQVRALLDGIRRIFDLPDAPQMRVALRKLHDTVVALAADGLAARELPTRKEIARGLRKCWETAYKADPAAYNAAGKQAYQAEADYVLDLLRKHAAPRFQVTNVEMFEALAAHANTNILADVSTAEAARRLNVVLARRGANVETEALRKRCEELEAELEACRRERDEALSAMRMAITVLDLKEADADPKVHDSWWLVEGCKGISLGLKDCHEHIANVERERDEALARLKGTLALADERSADKARLEHEVMRLRAELEALQNDYIKQGAGRLGSAQEHAALRAQLEALRSALAGVVSAMETWGSWEDGVPASDDAGEHGVVGEAYDHARMLLGYADDGKRIGGVLSSMPKPAPAEQPADAPAQPVANTPAWQHISSDGDAHTFRRRATGEMRTVEGFATWEEAAQYLDEPKPAGPFAEALSEARESLKVLGTGQLRTEPYQHPPTESEMVEQVDAGLAARVERLERDNTLLWMFMAYVGGDSQPWGDLSVHAAKALDARKEG